MTSQSRQKNQVKYIYSLRDAGYLKAPSFLRSQPTQYNSNIPCSVSPIKVEGRNPILAYSQVFSVQKETLNMLTRWPLKWDGNFNILLVGNSFFLSGKEPFIFQPWEDLEESRIVKESTSNKIFCVKNLCGFEFYVIVVFKKTWLIRVNKSAL